MPLTRKNHPKEPDLGRFGFGTVEGGGLKPFQTARGALEKRKEGAPPQQETFGGGLIPFIEVGRIEPLVPEGPSPFDLAEWWERQLTEEQRTEFLAGKMWEGTLEERQARLRSFYDKAHKKEMLVSYTNPLYRLKTELSKRGFTTHKGYTTADYHYERKVVEDMTYRNGVEVVTHPVTWTQQVWLSEGKGARWNACWNPNPASSMCDLPTKDLDAAVDKILKWVDDFDATKGSRAEAEKKLFEEHIEKARSAPRDVEPVGTGGAQSAYQRDVARGGDEKDKAVIQADGRTALLPDGTRLRVTPKGQPTVMDLVRRGYIIKMNYETARHRVVGVTEHEVYGLPVYSMGVVDLGVHQNKDGSYRATQMGGVNELVAQDGQVRKLFEANRDFVSDIVKTRPEETVDDIGRIIRKEPVAPESKLQAEPAKGQSTLGGGEAPKVSPSEYARVFFSGVPTSTLGGLRSEDVKPAAGGYWTPPVSRTWAPLLGRYLDYEKVRFPQGMTLETVESLSRLLGEYVSRTSRQWHKTYGKFFSVKPEDLQWFIDHYRAEILAQQATLPALGKTQMGEFKEGWRSFTKERFDEFSKHLLPPTKPNNNTNQA